MEIWGLLSFPLGPWEGFEFWKNDHRSFLGRRNPVFEISGPVCLEISGPSVLNSSRLFRGFKLVVGG